MASDTNVFNNTGFTVLQKSTPVYRYLYQYTGIDTGINKGDATNRNTTKIFKPNDN